MQDRGTVLVIDDEPDVLLLCRVNLEFEGYRVLEASDGEAGLALLRDHRPDVVLLDVTMPKLDGWEVLAAIKQDEELHDTPVVMLTARVHDDDQIRGWAQGAAEYVSKPFSPVTLAHVIADVLATDPEEEARRRQLILEKLELLRDE